MSLTFFKSGYYYGIRYFHLYGKFFCFIEKNIGNKELFQNWIWYVNFAYIGLLK